MDYKEKNKAFIEKFKLNPNTWIEVGEGIVEKYGIRVILRKNDDFQTFRFYKGPEEDQELMYKRKDLNSKIWFDLGYSLSREDWIASVDVTEDTDLNGISFQNSGRIEPILANMDKYPEKGSSVKISAQSDGEKIYFQIK